MSPRHNLVSEVTWITVYGPYVDDTGNTDVTIHECLTQAHRIIGICANTPMHTIATMRLLTAVVLDAYRDNYDALAHVETTGKFDTDIINNYLNEHHDKFHLVHDTHPFYQSIDLAEAITRTATTFSPISTLSPQFASGNTKTNWSHLTAEHYLDLSPADTARCLITTQHADAPGRAVRQSPWSKKNSGNASPITTYAQYIVVGTTLAASIAHHAMSVSHLVTDQDRPSWINRPPNEPRTRDPIGPCDWLSWPARRILLRTNNNDRYDRVYVTHGDAFNNASPPTQVDPFIATRKNKPVFPFRSRTESADDAFMTVHSKLPDAVYRALDQSVTGHLNVTVTGQQMNIGKYVGTMDITFTIYKGVCYRNLYDIINFVYNSKKIYWNVADLRGKILSEVERTYANTTNISQEIDITKILMSMPVIRGNEYDSLFKKVNKMFSLSEENKEKLSNKFGVKFPKKKAPNKPRNKRIPKQHNESIPASSQPYLILYHHHGDTHKVTSGISDDDTIFETSILTNYPSIRE